MWSFSGLFSSHMYYSYDSNVSSWSMSRCLTYDNWKLPYIHFQALECYQGLIVYLKIYFCKTRLPNCLSPNSEERTKLHLEAKYLSSCGSNIDCMCSMQQAIISYALCDWASTSLLLLLSHLSPGNRSCISSLAYNDHNLQHPPSHKDIYECWDCSTWKVWDWI